MRPLGEKGPTYGGSNDVIISTCPRCQESPDKHRIQWIAPGDGSTSLLDRFRRTLDAASRETLENDKLRDAYLELATNASGNVYATSMMGTAVATIGTVVKSYATLSGPGPSIILNWIKRDQLPKDLEIIDAANALTRGKLVDIQGKNFTPTHTPYGRSRDYPLGSCAAQKLVNQIFTDARTAKKEVKSIELSEMFWRDFAAERYNRDWSTGTVVPSCDTCKQVLPQMLCTNTED